jgi:hypothetical protein
MPAIPPFVLQKLYVKGSLRAEDDGFAFDLKNLVAPGTISAGTGLEVDGQTVDLAQVTITSANGRPRSIDKISPQAPLLFPVGAAITVHVAGQMLEPGSHELVIRVVIQEVGPLDIPIHDKVAHPS